MPGCWDSYAGCSGSTPAVQDLCQGYSGSTPGCSGLLRWLFRIYAEAAHIAKAAQDHRRGCSHRQDSCSCRRLHGLTTQEQDVDTFFPMGFNGPLSPLDSKRRFVKCKDQRTRCQVPRSVPRTSRMAATKTSPSR